jgi:hypothetical protein
METPKNKAELLEQMTAGRQEWEETLAQLSDKDLRQGGVEGAWSIKDMLAHICAYQQYMAAMMEDAKGDGQSATAALDSYYQTNLTMYRREHPELPEQISEVRGDMVNEVFVAAYKYKTPAEVRDMEQKAYLKLLRWVEAYSEEDLARAFTSNGKNFLQVIPNQCYAHYALHLPKIRAFAEGKKEG